MVGGGVRGFLTKHARTFVFIGLSIVVMAVAVYVLTRPSIADTVYFTVASSFFSGLIVALLIAALLQAGVILNSEDQHSSTLNAVLERVDEARSELDDQIRSTGKTVSSEVGARIDARYKWGLHSVDSNFEEGRLLDDVRNAKIKWLNTKFHRPDDQIDVIRAAVERGCNVKLLLMHPDSPFTQYRGMYTSPEYRDENELAKDVHNYQQSMRVSVHTMLTQYARLAREYPVPEADPADGELIPGFRLRFYSDAPGLPMLLRRSEHQKSGYTGFYLNDYSRNMPYLSWYGPGTAQARMVDCLFDYFDRKWFFSSKDDARTLNEDTFA